MVKNIENEILKHDLKHVIGACPSETEMIGIAKNIWNQTEYKTLSALLGKREETKLYSSKLSSTFAYSQTDIYDKQYSHGKRKINAIKQLHEKCVVWYANTDLKISQYVWVHMKTITWKFRILNLENSHVFRCKVSILLKN